MATDFWLKNFRPLAARSRYHCARKMPYFNTATAPERRNLTGKNRVWEFFRLSSKTHPANRRQPLQPRRKIRLTATETASGIPYWPSRDPIGERGGANLYGFCYNNSFFWYDFLGRDPKKVQEILNKLPPYDPRLARQEIPFSEIQERLDKITKEIERDREQAIRKDKCMRDSCDQYKDALSATKQHLEDLARILSLEINAQQTSGYLLEDLDVQALLTVAGGVYGIGWANKSAYVVVGTLWWNRMNSSYQLRDYLQKSFEVGEVRDEIKDTQSDIDDLESKLKKCKEDGYR